MPENTLGQARNAFNKATALFNAILDDGDASDDQIKAAEQAIEKAQVAYGEAIHFTLDERTKFLRTLTQALEQVIASIQLNPFGNILDKANNLLTSVNKIINDPNPEQDSNA